jgi:hypothetical protein
VVNTEKLPLLDMDEGRRIVKAAEPAAVPATDGTQHVV